MLDRKRCRSSDLKKKMLFVKHFECLDSMEKHYIIMPPFTITKNKYQETRKRFVCSLLYTGTVTCDRGDSGQSRIQFKNQFYSHNHQVHNIYSGGIQGSKGQREVTLQLTRIQTAGRSEVWENYTQERLVRRSHGLTLRKRSRVLE